MRVLRTAVHPSKITELSLCKITLYEADREEDKNGID